MIAVVCGNVTLDVICKTVDEVPRYESISFEQVAITPGGCGSNVAIGLSAQGISTALVACLGKDNASFLVERYWREAGLDLNYLCKVEDLPTGTSIGLVDSNFQPRFIHTSGANARLTVDNLDIQSYVDKGARALHIAGYFVLPGLMDSRLAGKLAKARKAGLLTSLDVVRTPRIDTPDSLWPCLPELDVFLCNAHEGWRLTGEEDPRRAALKLQAKGGNTIIVKLGSRGCWVESDTFQGNVPAPQVRVVDTTGAGDAFAAGLLAALLQREDIQQACRAANEAGARISGALGTLAGWGIK